MKYNVAGRAQDVLGEGLCVPADEDDGSSGAALLCIGVGPGPPRPVPHHDCAQHAARTACHSHTQVLSPFSSSPSSLKSDSCFSANCKHKKTDEQNLKDIFHSVVTVATYASLHVPNLLEPFEAAARKQ